MEHLPDYLLDWLLQYGSLTLFGLLALGIIAFPIPEETLMVVAGALMKHGDLYIAQTVIAAYAGSICGISISYLLGHTMGIYLIKKYGDRIGLNEQKMEKVHLWFERFGKWALFFGYFVPGIRHLTGFSAGTSNLSFREFVLFAYTGALVWVSTFLSIGYFFGGYWASFFTFVEEYLDLIITIAISIAILYLYIRIVRK